MKNAIGILGLFSALALIGGALGACSSSDNGGGSGGQDAGAKDGSTTKGKDAGRDDDTDDGDDDDTDPKPTGDDACAAEATKDACGQCCATNHAAGYKTFSETLLSCACEGTGADGGAAPCSTECGDTICATPQKAPTDACNKCLQDSVGQDGACLPPVSSACTADPDCLDQQKCVAQCQSKS